MRVIVCLRVITVCLRVITLFCALLIAYGCNHSSTTDEPQTVVKKVRTFALNSQSAADIHIFSGTLKAKTEIPIAFQVAGRIKTRLVDSGKKVAAGDILFTLDKHELEQSLMAAQAKLAAAEAELKLIQADLKRNRALMRKNSISRQAFERSQLQVQATKAQVRAARAQVELARINLQRTRISAQVPGIILKVTGTAGQVVTPGETIALLADMRDLDVELLLSDNLKAPPQAQGIDAHGKPLKLRLREVAGAADPVSRTWLVRYRVENPDPSLRLGSIIKVGLQEALSQNSIFRIPLAALDERGEGTRVWKIQQQKAQAIPVELVKISTSAPEYVQVQSPDLQPGDQIIALGTHLLTEGMAVAPLKVEGQQP